MGLTGEIPRIAPAAQPPRVRYMRLTAFAVAVGYTEKAVRRKIEDGVWTEGREYVRAPDGRVFVDLDGFERWVTT